MNSQITKNQHWVPQFYLRHFSTKSLQGSLYVTDIKRYYAGDGSYLPAFGQPSSAPKQKLDAIASMEYLYSHIESGEIVNGMEDSVFQPMEAEVGVFFQQCANDQLDIDDVDTRAQLALFIAALHMRHPRMVALALGVAPEAAPLGGSHADIEAREPFREAQRYTLHIAQMIANRAWHLIRFDEPVLITSDTPVILMNGSDFSQGSFEWPTSSVYFPMTPRHLLVIAGTGVRMAPRPAGSTRLGENMNRYFINYAERFVYSAAPIPKEWARDVVPADA